MRGDITRLASSPLGTLPTTDTSQTTKADFQGFGQDGQTYDRCICLSGPPSPDPDLHRAERIYVALHRRHSVFKSHCLLMVGWMQSSDCCRWTGMTATLAVLVEQLEQWAFRDCLPAFAGTFARSTAGISSSGTSCSREWRAQFCWRTAQFPERKQLNMTFSGVASSNWT